MRHNIDIEEEQKNHIDWKVLKKLLPRFRPYLFSLILCAGLLGIFSILSLAGPLLIRHAIDVNFAKKDLNGLINTVIIYFITLLLSFVFNYYQRINLEIIGQKIITGIRIDIFTRLTGMSQSFFDKNPVGQLLSRVESDTEALRSMFTFTVVMLVSDILMVFGMFIIMFTISLPLTIILLAAFPFIIINILYFNKKIIPLFIQVRKKTAEIYGFLEEYIKGAIIVRSFTQEENVINKINILNKSKVDIEYKSSVYTNYFFQLIFLISIISMSLILGTGGIWIIKYPGTMTVGTLVAFLGYIQRFFGPIFHISEQISVIQKAFAGAKRINEIMEIPVEEEQPYKNNVVKNGKHSIEFKNVWFAYKNEEWVLKDISFQITRGQNIALVGSTGSGKTTIISLLFRFYLPQKGQIFLDGTDIKDYPLKELREKLGLVMQDIILFPGTILDNLSMGKKKINEDDVLNAIDLMKSRDFIEKFPDKLNTSISEHGNNLSVGEKQLLSFARALISKPDIFILDEATSSIDPLTEKKLQESIKTILKDKTAIIIAHRLQTIAFCDEILVMDGGIIKERGKHNELLSIDGIYRNLYQIQHGTI